VTVGVRTAAAHRVKRSRILNVRLSTLPHQRSQRFPRLSRKTGPSVSREETHRVWDGRSTASKTVAARRTRPTRCCDDTDDHLFSTYGIPRTSILLYSRHA